MKLKNLYYHNIIVYFLICIAASVIYTKRSSDIFISQTEKALEQIALEKAGNLDSHFDYYMECIKLISHAASERMPEREMKEPDKILSSYAKDAPFDFIEYVRWDGINCHNASTGGQAFDASDRIYYKDGIKGNSGTWVNLNPKFLDGVILNFYTPLYYEEEIAGVLTGAIDSYASLRPVINTSIYGQDVSVFVCDENQNIVASSTKNDYLKISLNDYKDSELFSDVLLHMEEKKYSAFEYDQNGKTGICVVSPLEKEGWHVFLVIHPATLSSCLKGIQNSSFIFIAILLIVFVLLGMVLMFKTKREKDFSAE